jgi:CheY-like chemotaxis protein
MTHVLVVDADEDTRAILREVLKLRGYAVTTARDGLEGVSEVLRATEPLVVVLDHRQPYLSGSDVLRILTLIAPPPVPLVVVLMSSEDAIKWMRTALSSRPPFPLLGLVKPFDLDTVSEVVATAAGLLPLPIGSPTDSR